MMLYASQVTLIALLLESGAIVHISLDLWSSPNGYSMLGVICHFIDRAFKARTVLFGVKALHGPHSGKNMAAPLIKVMRDLRPP